MSTEPISKTSADLEQANSIAPTDPTKAEELYRGILSEQTCTSSQINPLSMLTIQPMKMLYEIRRRRLLSLELCIGITSELEVSDEGSQLI
jgi:hypothetical protein